MPKKLPKDSKPELIAKIKLLLAHTFDDSDDAIEYMLDQMSTWDLVAIQEELRNVLKSRNSKTVE